MKRVGFWLIMLFGVLLFIQNTSAENIIGVSPSNIYFPGVLRGGYAERMVTVSFDSAEPTGLEISARGDIANWIVVPSRNFTASKENPARFPIAVEPPSDVPNGNYTGFVRIITAPTSDELNTGHAAGRVRAAIDVEVTVEIVDNEVRECGAGEFFIGSAEKGEKIPIRFSVTNRGNVRLRPELLLAIWDQSQINIVDQLDFRGSEILPTRSATLNFTMDSDTLDIGQYWADMKVEDCFASDILTFDVLEPGTLKAEGILLGIKTKPIAQTGETVPVIVIFKNTGEKDVDAQFRGKVMLGDEIVQVFESEKSSVPLSTISNFTFYFTPKKEGKYVISGRVFYDKKRTFEASNTVDVLAKPWSLGSMIWIALYGAIIAVLLLLIYKIRTERRKYSERLRRLRWSRM